jgi:8-oxo-dGTP pyrophosphatase MutT (NUDIX family)
MTAMELKSPHILHKTVISCGKYQGLGTVTYIDPRDNTKTPRERDYIFLRNRNPHIAVGTLIPNIYKDDQNQWCTILVQQFRPQYESDTIEFPAGFINNNRTGDTVPETAEQAAVRELEEETTKTGTVINTSPPLTSDPLPIAARLAAVFVCARDKEGVEAGKQRLDKGEFAVELQVPLLELETRLRGFEGEGVVIDPRVWMFAMGIRFALELGLEKSRL